MKDISRQLFARGMHRMFGNPSIGTLTGFLTVIFIIRAAVNLYFVFDISEGETPIILSQIGNGWFLYIAAYIISCSSLSAFHVNYALPDRSFVELSPGGTKFKSIFIKQAVFMRPMNLAVFIVVIIGSYIYIKSGGNILIIISGLLILLISVAGAYIIFKLAKKLSPERIDIQVLEFVFLVTLVMLNPDIIQYEGKVIMLIYGHYYPLESSVISFLSIFSFLILTSITLIIVKSISIFNKILNARRFNDPLLSWYWHFFKIKFWLILYILIFPIIFLTTLPIKIKCQAALVFLIFSLISYLVFINHCTNSTRDKWRNNLLSKNNIRLAIRPFFMHLFLTLLPLSGLILIN